MSRIVKYRVWDKEQRHMFAVPSLHFGDDGSGRTITMWIKTPGTHNGLLVMGENAELMQFTGLLDKNGKEVYEGDIIKAALVETGEIKQAIEAVTYDNKHAAYLPFCQRMAYDEGLWIECVDGFEVIGNIYQHPALLILQEPRT